MSARLRYGILGPITVTCDGVPLRIGGAKPKAILAALLMSAGRVVSAGSLVDVLWTEPPERAAQTLQVHISNLRKQLGGAEPGIRTHPPGYVIDAAADELDFALFERLRREAGQARTRAQHPEATALLREALALWTGEGLDDLDDSDFVERSRRYLGGARLAAAEELAQTQLDAHDPAGALRTADEQLVSSPLRESLWELKMTALYRLGRQAEAIAAYHECRDVLDEELGLDPSPRVRELYERMLRQDPALVSSAAPADLPRTVTAELAAGMLVGLGRTYSLGSVTVIGRNPDCEISLDDPLVSRRHAEIRSAAGSHLIHDLGSSNGTRVNGALISQHLLAAGDQIGIGGASFTYMSGEAHAPPP